jgi:hypothetical protein
MSVTGGATAGRTVPARLERALRQRAAPYVLLAVLVVASVGVRCFRLEQPCEHSCRDHAAAWVTVSVLTAVVVTVCVFVDVLVVVTVRVTVCGGAAFVTVFVGGGGGGGIHAARPCVSDQSR